MPSALRASAVGLAALVGSLWLMAPASTQEKEAVKKPTTAHASLAAYPNAVISLKDPKTRTIFYVESNGRRLVALSDAGAVVWSIDLLAEAGIKPAVGEPVIRHLRLEDDALHVTCGKSDTAKVNVKTGKAERLGSD